VVSKFVRHVTDYLELSAGLMGFHDDETFQAPEAFLDVAEIPLKSASHIGTHRALLRSMHASSQGSSASYFWGCRGRRPQNQRVIQSAATIPRFPWRNLQQLIATSHINGVLINADSATSNRPVLVGTNVRIDLDTESAASVWTSS